MAMKARNLPVLGPRGFVDLALGVGGPVRPALMADDPIAAVRDFLRAG